MDKKWRVRESEEIFSNNFFRLRKDECEIPDGRIMPNYYVLEYANWVNVVPVTHDGKIVLIKQYRHATGDICIEIPGGSMDPGDAMDTKGAALREMEEETGYVADDIRLVSKHHPNPAAQNNAMYTYIAFGCQRLKEQNLDPFEDIEVFTVPVHEALELAFSGKITHSLILASLFQALPFLGYKIV